MPEGAQVNQGASKRYMLGVMRAPVETPPPEGFNPLINAALRDVKDKLTEDLDLDVRIFDFAGPHLVPTGGAYSPFDFLKIGLTEKLERKIHFLLIISEVELSTSSLSYVLALPSQITNVGIISTRRLSPNFADGSANWEQAGNRLSALMLHTFGHILNLHHNDDPTNVMHNIVEVDDLDGMRDLTSHQLDQIRLNLPREAREDVGKRGDFGFIVAQVVSNADAIAQAVLRANPLRLIGRLPTMIAAGGSTILALFLTAEVWDLASTISWLQLSTWIIFSLAVSTSVLYRAFSLRLILTRQKRLPESLIVTTAATQLSLLLTTIIILLGFFLIALAAIILVFPQELQETWPTLSPAITLGDHLRMGMILGVIALLAGSLGGRADSAELIRYVLFLDEET